jgi:hexulose-6-phosphate isomerase
VKQFNANNRLLSAMKSNLVRRKFFKAAAVLVTASLLLAVSLVAAPDKPLKKAVMIDTLGLKGSLEDRFKAMKAAGFEGVELSSHMNQDEVVKALAASGLKAASVCCSTHWRDTLSSPNPEVRAKGLEGVKQALRDAKRYGATSVLVVPGVVNKDTTFDECWKRSIEQIRLAIPVAEELGVKIAIENVWNNFITTPEQAVKFLDEINSPWVGWHFDTGNVIKYSPPETWIPLLGKRIVKVHFKEYSKAKGFDVEFFQGDNNWPAIMKALDAAGYSDWAITEMPGKQTKDVESLKTFSDKLGKVLTSQ